MKCCDYSWPCEFDRAQRVVVAVVGHSTMKESLSVH
jgi:hypothetical protein